MTTEVKILIADDDSGDARLIEKNLQRVGRQNPIERFENGQEVLDFLLRRGDKFSKAINQFGMFVSLEQVLKLN